MTFYKSTSQLPDFLDYAMKNRTYRYFKEEPLFPFGFGLSYTTFQYGDAKVSSKEIKAGKSCRLTIPVTNTGNRDGEEVVQVYLSRPDDKEGPSHTLRAFKRVLIRKGETKRITFELNAESFEWFDRRTNTMHPIEGNYQILYGGSSDKKQLKSINVKLI